MKNDQIGLAEIIDTAATLSVDNGIKYFNLNFLEYISICPDLLLHKEKTSVYKAINNLTAKHINRSDFSKQYLLTTIIKTLHSQSNAPENHHKQWIKEISNNITLDVFEKALESRDLELVKFIIEQRKSVSTSASNAFQFLKPTDLTTLSAILLSIKSCYIDFDEEQLIHQVQFVLGRHLLEPQFPNWITELSNQVPNVMKSIDYSKLINRSISSFKPNALLSLQQYIDNHFFCSMDLKDLFKSISLPDDLNSDSVLKTLDFLSYMYFNKSSLPETKIHENLAQIFNVCSYSSDFSLLTDLARHELLNEFNFKGLLSDDAKATYLSINLAESLEKSIDFDTPSVDHLPSLTDLCTFNL